ncbi:MAG: hypothetical protein KAS11_03390 [Candidatus Aenigmarchaeota archaeon]|nr:hypothetical protein [Candidatus Aenigmarchaeota archaeon]
MDISELDYHGIFPKRKEDRNTFLKRGEEFYNDALEIKDHLRKDISGIVEQKDLFSKREYTTRIIKKEIAKKGDFKLLDISKDFFIDNYRTCPDWISAIEADSNSRKPGMLYVDITFDYYLNVKKNEIPMFFSFPKKMDINQFLEEETSAEKRINNLKNFNEKQNKQVIIDIIRDPLNRNYKNLSFFSWPWTKYESAPEQCILDRLSDSEWNQTYMEIDMRRASYDIISGILFTSLSLTLVFSSAIQNAEYLLWTMLGLNFFKNAVKQYRSSSNTPSTRIAVEDILSSEEDERINMQYAMLRLTPPEIREIGKYQKKENVPGTEAIQSVLKKRKTLMSEIILKNI